MQCRQLLTQRSCIQLTQLAVKVIDGPAAWWKALQATL